MEEKEKIIPEQRETVNETTKSRGWSWICCCLGRKQRKNNNLSPPIAPHKTTPSTPSTQDEDERLVSKELDVSRSYVPTARVPQTSVTLNKSLPDNLDDSKTNSFPNHTGNTRFLPNGIEVVTDEDSQNSEGSIIDVEAIQPAIDSTLGRSYQVDTESGGIIETTQRLQS